MHNQPKIAIVGVGRWGKKLLQEFSRQTEVMAICHRDSSETNAWLAENYPTIPHLELSDICQRKDIKAVIVVTPPTTHHQIARQILESNKDVWVEKPVGINANETIGLTQLAQARGQILFTDYVYLYHPAWEKIKKIIAERQETPSWLNCSWQKWGTFSTPIEDNLLCHDIALAQDLFHTSIDAKRLTSTGSISTVDILMTKFYRDGQTIGLSYINRLSANRSKEVLVKGERGSILIWENDRLYESKNGQLEEIALNPETALEKECRAFLRAIGDRNEPLTDGDFAVKVRRSLDALSV